MKKKKKIKWDQLIVFLSAGWMGNVVEQVLIHVCASHLITVERRTPQLANLLPVQTATRLAALLPF